MKTMAWLVLIGSLLGFQPLSIAGSRPNANTQHWKTCRIELGDRILQFSIPPGESQEVPKYDVPKRVDLKPELFDETLAGPLLLDRMWDYRSHRLARVDGSLRAVITLHRSEQRLDTYANQVSAIENASRLFTAKAYLEEGRARASNNPVRISRTTIGAVNALQVQYELSPSDDYVVVVDSYHYLEISVFLSGFTRQDWEDDAKSAAQAILDSIRLESR